MRGFIRSIAASIGARIPVVVLVTVLPVLTQCAGSEEEETDYRGIGWLELAHDFDSFRPADYMTVLQSSLGAVNAAIGAQFIDALPIEPALTNLTTTYCDDETGYPLAGEGEPTQGDGMVANQLAMDHPGYASRYLYCQLEAKESLRTARGMQKMLDSLICALQRDGHLSTARFDGEERLVEFGFKRSCFSRKRIDRMIEQFETSLATVKLQATQSNEGPLWRLALTLSEMSWMDPAVVWQIRFGLSEQRELALSFLAFDLEQEHRQGHYLIVLGQDGSIQLQWKQLGISEDDWLELPAVASSLATRLTNQRFQLVMRGHVNGESRRFSRVDQMQVLGSEVAMFRGEGAQPWRQVAVYTAEGRPDRGFFSRGHLCGANGAAGCQELLNPEAYQVSESCYPSLVACGDGRGIAVDNPLLAAFAMAGPPSLGAYRLPQEEFADLTVLPRRLEVERRDGFTASQ